MSKESNSSIQHDLSGIMLELNDDSLDFSRGEKRREQYNQESENDRRLRKCTMIDILILIFLFGLFKIFALIGNGYFTFRRVDRPDCFSQ